MANIINIIIPILIFLMTICIGLLIGYVAKKCGEKQIQRQQYKKEQIIKKEYEEYKSKINIGSILYLTIEDYKNNPFIQNKDNDKIFVKILDLKHDWVKYCYKGYDEKWLDYFPKYIEISELQKLGYKIAE